MKRLPAFAYLLFGILSINAARADEALGPICARDEVIAHVAREVRWHAPYAALLPHTIAERPGPVRDIVLCVVTVTDRDFDAVRYRTETWIETQLYSVRRLHSGYEVTMGGLH